MEAFDPLARSGWRTPWRMAGLSPYRAPKEELELGGMSTATSSGMSWRSVVPTRRTAPTGTVALVRRTPSRKVPFRDPRSATSNPLLVGTMVQWRRDTAASVRGTSAAGSAPTTTPTGGMAILTGSPPPPPPPLAFALALAPAPAFALTTRRRQRSAAVCRWIWLVTRVIAIARPRPYRNRPTARLAVRDPPPARRSRDVGYFRRHGGCERGGTTPTGHLMRKVALVFATLFLLATTGLGILATNRGLKDAKAIDEIVGPYKGQLAAAAKADPQVAEMSHLAERTGKLKAGAVFFGIAAVLALGLLIVTFAGKSIVPVVAAAVAGVAVIGTFQPAVRSRAVRAGVGALARLRHHCAGGRRRRRRLGRLTLAPPGAMA
jgi:hypothetical protein